MEPRREGSEAGLPLGETPAAVAECLGAALGSVAWPLPAQRESLPFPIVGG